MGEHILSRGVVQVRLRRELGLVHCQRDAVPILIYPQETQVAHVFLRIGVHFVDQLLVEADVSVEELCRNCDNVRRWLCEAKSKSGEKMWVNF